MIEHGFKKFLKNEGTLYLDCNDKKAFPLQLTIEGVNVGFFVCDTLSYVSDNIYVIFCNKLYRQIIGTPMETNCVHFVAVWLLFCYETVFMSSLSDDNLADIIESFNSTSRY